MSPHGGDDHDPPASKAPFAARPRFASDDDGQRPLLPGDLGLPDDEATGWRLRELEAENRTLRAEVEQLRHLLNSATDYAVITMNLGGRITGWNAGARVILDYAEAEILGRSGEVFFPPQERADGVFVGELCRAMEEGRAVNERWHLRRDGSRFWASGSMMPLRDGDGRVKGFLNVFRDNTAAQAEAERRALLLAEMGHRVKNTLATVQAVAAQTLRQSGVPAEVQQAFSARLLALARSHELLTRGDGEGARLAEVVERALLPYGGSDRAALSGPSVRLPANAVEMFGLAFHELATNAAKYGALSVPEGRVEVRWSLREARSGGWLVDVTWREHDGPAVAPPQRQGFGSRLLEHGLVRDLGGTVKLDFRPEGLECSICLPVAAEVDGT
ncbi:sensor histidine kinase [Roseomonas elaeocarpi]|uniref:histidine kinase n=1 Tax=Roseomonas elaeocarpi TaxID=907779 RepID=A0ABV6JPV3_9PROT